MYRIVLHGKLLEHKRKRVGNCCETNESEIIYFIPQEYGVDGAGNVRAIQSQKST